MSSHFRKEAVERIRKKKGSKCFSLCDNFINSHNNRYHLHLGPQRVDLLSSVPGYNNHFKRNELKKGERGGAFHSTQNWNSGNFGWYIRWNKPLRFGSTGIFGTSFEGGPLWPVWSFRSVGPKCFFPFDKIVALSTGILLKGKRLGFHFVWSTDIQPAFNIILFYDYYFI